jgi:hypothetical protein
METRGSHLFFTSRNLLGRSRLKYSGGFLLAKLPLLTFLQYYTWTLNINI